MRDIDTSVTSYDMVNDTDCEGNTFSYMVPEPQGYWVSFADHDMLVSKLKDRITYLENVCDEQVRMLTGD